MIISSGSSAVYLDIEHVDIGESFEQHRLPFHDGLSGQRTDISQAKDRSSVGKNGDEISAGRVLEGIAADFSESPGKARRRQECTRG